MEYFQNLTNENQKQVMKIMNWEAGEFYKTKYWMMNGASVFLMHLQLIPAEKPLMKLWKWL